MKRLICICIAVILLAAAPAMAIDGNFLKESADDGEKYPDSYGGGYLDGYVVGVVEGIATNTKPCIPSGVTNKQVADVVRKFLKDHPEKLHLPARDLVLEAIHTAWACK